MELKAKFNDKKAFEITRTIINLVGCSKMWEYFKPVKLLGDKNAVVWLVEFFNDLLQKKKEYFVSIK